MFTPPSYLGAAGWPSATRSPSSRASPPRESRRPPARRRRRSIGAQAFSSATRRARIAAAREGSRAINQSTYSHTHESYHEQRRRVEAALGDDFKFYVHEGGAFDAITTRLFEQGREPKTSHTTWPSHVRHPDTHARAGFTGWPRSSPRSGCTARCYMTRGGRRTPVERRSSSCPRIWPPRRRPRTGATPSDWTASSRRWKGTRTSARTAGGTTSSGTRRETRASRGASGSRG